MRFLLGDNQMSASNIKFYSEGNERIAKVQQLTQLHPCWMHPCQLLFLALECNPTPMFYVLQGYETTGLSCTLDRLLLAENCFLALTNAYFRFAQQSGRSVDHPMALCRPGFCC